MDKGKMTACFCTGECHKTGRCPNARGWIEFENGKDFMPKFPKDTPCANEAMDKWEDENLPLHERRKPRMLYCGCPKCNRVTL